MIDSELPNTSQSILQLLQESAQEAKNRAAATRAGKRGPIKRPTWDKPLEVVHFKCGHCRWDFDSDKFETREATEDSAYPWEYFATCPKCGTESPEAGQYKNVRHMLATRKTTGPKTAEGKAAIADNGFRTHPLTAQQKQFTRLNALRHGAYAATVQFYPARPGSQWCGNCEISPEYCRQQPACIKNAELFMRHRLAFESNDASLLRSLRADLHANIEILINMMIADIVRRGVTLERLDWHVDANGAVQFVDAPPQVYAHPLLRTLSDMLGKVGLTLGDSGMTERQADDTGSLPGNLQPGSAESEEEYMRRQAEQLEALQGMIERSRERVKSDPVLIEYQDGE